MDFFENFVEILWEFFWRIYLRIFFFGIFRGLFCEKFFGGFFWEDFGRRILLGGINLGESFWEDFGRIFFEELFVYIGIELIVKILVFVKILSPWKEEGRKNFNP